MLSYDEVIKQGVAVDELKSITDKFLAIIEGVSLDDELSRQDSRYVKSNSSDSEQLTIYAVGSSLVGYMLGGRG